MELIKGRKYIIVGRASNPKDNVYFFGTDTTKIIFEITHDDYPYNYTCVATDGSYSKNITQGLDPDWIGTKLKIIPLTGAAEVLYG